MRLSGAFLLNCELFALTLLFALPLGLVVSFGSMSRCKPLAGLVKTFVWIIRGTPLMLQIIVIYLGPGLLGMNNPWPSGSGGRMVAAVVAFAINYACYFSEIYRGGIEAVPKGQTEAGQVLGMTKTQIFFKVTLLQQDIVGIHTNPCQTTRRLHCSVYHHGTSRTFSRLQVSPRE